MPKAKRYVAAGLILLLIFIMNTETKFLNQSIITMDEYYGYIPTNVFYYNGAIHLPLSVYNTGRSMLSSLVRFDENFKVDKNLTFPTSCTEIPCQVSLTSFMVQGDLAYLFITADSNNYGDVYYVDLRNLAIQRVHSTKYLPQSFTFYNWIPYNNETVYIQASPYDTESSTIVLRPLDLPSFGFGAAITLPFNNYQLGFAAGNTLFFQAYLESSFREYILINVNLTTMSIISQVSPHNSSGPAAKIKDQDALALSPYTDWGEGVDYVTVTDIDKPLPNKFDTQKVYKSGTVSNVVAEPSYSFISTIEQSETGDQSSKVIQVDLKSNPVKTVDVISVPSPWLVVANPSCCPAVQSNGVDYKKKQLAQIGYDWGSGTSAVIVADYD